MTKARIKFKDLGDLLEAEAQRLGAEHKCWGTLDLGKGTVVTLAWFGPKAEMTLLGRQLDALPKVGFGFLSKRTSARKIAAALRVNDVAALRVTDVKRSAVQRGRKRKGV